MAKKKKSLHHVLHKPVHHSVSVFFIGAGLFALFFIIIAIVISQR